MRHKPSFAFRALFSFAAVMLLALIAMLPTNSQATPVTRPALQATPDTNTAIDLTVDNSVKFGDPGSFVTYRFTIFNNATNGCSTGTFRFNQTGPFGADITRNYTANPVCSSDTSRSR